MMMSRTTITERESFGELGVEHYYGCPPSMDEDIKKREVLCEEGRKKVCHFAVCMGGTISRTYR